MVMYNKAPGLRSNKVTSDEGEQRLNNLINDMPHLPPVIVDVPTSYSYHTKMMDVNAPANNTYSNKLLECVECLVNVSKHNMHNTNKLEKEVRFIKRVLLSQNPRGEVFSILVPLSPSIGRVHINFEDSSMGYNTPDGINIPQSQLYQLIMINNGSSDAKFRTNAARNDTAADSTLLAGVTNQIDLKFHVPTVRTINLACPSGSTTVTLLCVV